MKNIALLGAGSHSRNEHIPALQYLLGTRNDFRVVAVCDLNANLAAEAARILGQAKVYTDFDTLLAHPQLDGIIAVTPTALTTTLTCQILNAGIPVLMEKPLGVNLIEAHAVVDCAAKTGTPVMVGMNRRHDAVMRQASVWLKDRDILYARAAIHRQNRTEKGFIQDAVIHPVDTLCGLLGQGTVESIHPLEAAAGEAGIAHLLFSEKTKAIVEWLPACGRWEESYLFAGPGWSIVAEPQRSCTLKDRSIPTETFTAPEGLAGRWTTGETESFLAALHGRAVWAPTPEAVLRSMALTAQLSSFTSQL